MRLVPRGAGFRTPEPARRPATSRTATGRRETAACRARLHPAPGWAGNAHPAWSASGPRPPERRLDPGRDRRAAVTARPPDRADSARSSLASTMSPGGAIARLRGGGARTLHANSSFTWPRFARGRAPSRPRRTGKIATTSASLRRQESDGRSGERSDYSLPVPAGAPLPRVPTTLKPFLATKGHRPEEVEKMHEAWRKAVLLQVILWSHPYVTDGDF